MANTLNIEVAFVSVQSMCIYYTAVKGVDQQEKQRLSST